VSALLLARLRETEARLVSVRGKPGGPVEPDGDWERSVLLTIKDVQQGLDGKCIGWEYPGRGARDRVPASRFCRADQENRCLSLGVGRMLQSQRLLSEAFSPGASNNSQNPWVGKPTVTHI